jgi:hypothetical protein
MPDVCSGEARRPVLSSDPVAVTFGPGGRTFTYELLL